MVSAVITTKMASWMLPTTSYRADASGLTGAGLLADGNHNSQIDPGDYDVSRTHFGQSAASALLAERAESLRQFLSQNQLSCWR